MTPTPTPTWRATPWGYLLAAEDAHTNVRYELASVVAHPGLWTSHVHSTGETRRFMDLNDACVWCIEKLQDDVSVAPSVPDLLGRPAPRHQRPSDNVDPNRRTTR